jgi:hypothetical protein
MYASIVSVIPQNYYANDNIGCQKPPKAQASLLIRQFPY